MGLQFITWCFCICRILQRKWNDKDYVKLMEETFPFENGYEIIAFVYGVFFDFFEVIV